jgi:hypothetical protein
MDEYGVRRMTDIVRWKPEIVGEKCAPCHCVMASRRADFMK